ncbi:MAG: helix-turn-helix domain-containing protein [Actinoallomurus sp.]
MDTPGDPPPEGRLIEEAREAMRGMSQNKAAKLAGMSGTRWRQIVTGVASGGKGIVIPVHGNPETVARMAQVVGVTPERLADVGREDAARELRALPLPNSPDDSDRDAIVDRLVAQVAEQQMQIDELQRQVKEALGEGKQQHKSG